MRLRDILKHKGSAIHAIGPQATLDEVVKKLVEQNCGSLVVTEGDKMVGIITERDILRAHAQCGEPLADIRVVDRMTEEVLTGGPDDTIQQTMSLMTEHRIRHLPVLDEGRLAGLISIGDVVKAQSNHLKFENHYLKSYIFS